MVASELNRDPLDLSGHVGGGPGEAGQSWGRGGRNPRDRIPDRGGSCYGLARNSLRITAHCPGWVLTWGVSWIHPPDPKRLQRVSDLSVPTLAPPAPGGVPRPLPSDPPGPLHTPTCQARAPPFWPLPPSPSQEPSWSLEMQGSGKLVLGALDGSGQLGSTP